MSIIKKILFCLVFLFTSFFLFRDDVSAYCINIYENCPTGYTISYSSSSCPEAECVFTGCHGLNGIDYAAGVNGITSAACFETGASACYAWTSWADSTVAEPGHLFDPLPGGNSTGLCKWHSDSYCNCLGDNVWKKGGSGCVGNLYCNNSAGWYSSCDAAWGNEPTGDCWYSYNRCRPCGNSSQQCYKKNINNYTIICENDNVCGAGRCCKNPGLNSSYCSTDCGTSSSGCYTPAGGACANAGGTCSTTAIANTTTKSGLCPSTSACLCRIPITPSFVCESRSSADAATCAAFGGNCDDPANYSNPVYLTGLCTGSGANAAKCRCVKQCPADCSISGDYCPDQTFDDGCGGTCTGTKTPVNNIIGACGTANGGTYSSLPASNLCAVGTINWTDNIGSDGLYKWTCSGSNGTCVAAQTLDTPCSAVRDNPPAFSTLVIENINNTVVAAETDNRNHICQSDFTSTSSPTTARFVVTYSDAQGGADINNIQLTLGSQVFNYSSISRSGNNVTAIFDITTAQISSTDLQKITVSASDVNVYTGSVVTTDTNRSFKYWNCNVPVSGNIFDGSGANPSVYCPSPSIGFSSYVNDINFKNLTFKNAAAGDKNMTLTSLHSFSSTGNDLVWGKSYTLDFNDDIKMNESTIKMRFNGNSSCQSNIALTGTSPISPYDSSVSLTVDFSGVVNQDPWWQTVGGGVVSNFGIANRVPVTCTTANCKISPSGLISAPNISNAGRDPLSNAQAWYYQSAAAKLVINNTNYNYFLSQYHNKNSIGTILTGDKTITSLSDLGSDPNNIFFVNGNLTINGNILKSGNFLMIIVSGNISIANNVTQVDGILVANNITAAGTNTTALTFNGSLYAASDINFSGRDLGGSNNNLNPAVVVNHNPQMIFNLPGSLAKVLTNWQWGN
ncbi:MAG: hypothetical protein PHE32_03455 [Candidatus Shapirobacteria bacterium]|nr:hypothetical protein [Candidatus Shapirobacteria bacterium]MDD4410730.1 hypothetical protein [Candidatus Shapirobacteria bacterium]